jgi:hypothetical protein
LDHLDITRLAEELICIDARIDATRLQGILGLEEGPYGVVPRIVDNVKGIATKWEAIIVP